MAPTMLKLLLDFFKICAPQIHTAYYCALFHIESKMEGKHSVNLVETSEGAGGS
jgi:hypothetical protein